MAKNPSKSGNPATRAKALQQAKTKKKHSEVAPEPVEKEVEVPQKVPRLLLFSMGLVFLLISGFTLWRTWGFEGQIPITAIVFAAMMAFAGLAFYAWILSFILARGTRKKRLQRFIVFAIVAIFVVFTIFSTGALESIGGSDNETSEGDIEFGFATG